MRISDWSSDVCSSDLLDELRRVQAHHGQREYAVGRLGKIQHRRFQQQFAARKRPAAFLDLHMLLWQKLIADDAILHRYAGVHLADGRGLAGRGGHAQQVRSEEHTSELQSLMRISYA